MQMLRVGLQHGMRVLAAMALGLAALGQPGRAAASPMAEPLAGSFTVTSNQDTNLSDTVLTLREALLVARGGTGPTGLNGAVSNDEKALLVGCTFSGNIIISGCGAGIADTIIFSPTLVSNTTITLLSALPAITDTAATILDATSRNITVDAAAIGAGSDGLSVGSNNNQVLGLIIANAPRDGLAVTGSHNLLGGGMSLIRSGRYGVRLDGGDENHIDSMWVGLRPSAAVGACPDGNHSGGVILLNGAVSNTVEAIAAKCNTNFGVLFSGAGVTGNVLQDGLITNQNGYGVVLESGAHHNQIGSDPLPNEISANSNDGIWISDADFNSIYDNFIGVKFPGNTAAANQGDGVRVSNGAQGNHIGELGSNLHRNIISGNSGAGVRLESGAFQNIVESNFIGLNGAGTAAIPNGSDGVAVVNADNNNVGSSGAGVLQAISGNGGNGVYLENSDFIFVGQTNLVGTRGDGSGQLGNAGNGVRIVDAQRVTVFASIIANNGGAGVRVTGGTSISNTITSAQIMNNVGLPVDLDGLGANPNDPGDTDDGPNHLLNYPVLTSAVTTTVTGTACPNCQIYIYEAFGDPSAPSGGVQYRTSTTADGSGVWTKTVAGLTSDRLTFLACQPSCSSGGNTSEFSPRPYLLLPLVMR